MSDKKYYLISEVAEILKIPLYKLRYLEKSRSDIKIQKIKSRRYYTKENITKLKAYCKIGINNPFIANSINLENFKNNNDLKLTEFNNQENIFDDINLKIDENMGCSIDINKPDEYILKIEELIKKFQSIKDQLNIKIKNY